MKVGFLSNQIDRFWSHVNKTDYCWEWDGAKTQGYGEIHINGKPMRAHRFAYELLVGPINNFWVLHRCDNPSCVNPAHLFLGTPKDNTKDMISKNRKNDTIRARGTDNGSHKLTEQEVLEIRELSAQGNSDLNIAKQYNVSKTTIKNIRRGSAWTWLV